MEDRKDLHRRILVNLGVALAGVLFLIFVVPQLVRFLMPLIVAWIVAMIANPIIRFLENDQDHAKAWLSTCDHSGAGGIDRGILWTRGAGGVAV